jgi:Spy/CpxP family protein refolding chaperone
MPAGISAGKPLASERATWQNPRILSTLLLVFLAGGATGAVSMKFGLHQLLHKSSVPTSKEGVLQKFRTDLNLTPAQTQKISLILDDYQHYYQSVQDQQDDIRATGKMRILQELDPAQRDKFQKMMGEIPPQLAPKP